MNMNMYRTHARTASTTMLGVLVALLIAFFSAAGYASGTRVAVAADAAGAEAPVSGVAARAPYILIFDAGGKLVESQPNPFAKVTGDAGPPIAGWLAERQVGTFIAGAFGSKLSQAMKERGIRGIVARGLAAAAVKEAQR